MRSFSQSCGLSLRATPWRLRASSLCFKTGAPAALMLMDTPCQGEVMSSQYDPRITTYFGDAVMRAGFIPIPHLFLRHYRALGLSANQAMFLLQIMEGAWDLAAPPRTVGDLAARMGVDSRTIRRYTEE